MNDATSLTPPSAWAELHFQMQKNIHVHSMIPEDQKKNNYTMMKYGSTFYSRHTGTHKTTAIVTLKPARGLSAGLNFWCLLNNLGLVWPISINWKSISRFSLGLLYRRLRLRILLLKFSNSSNTWVFLAYWEHCILVAYVKRQLGIVLQMLLIKFTVTVATC